MDFKLPPEAEAYRARYRDFVRNHVLPYDTTPESFDEHENIRPELLALLRAKARDEGLCRRCRARAAGRAWAWWAWPPATRSSTTRSSGPWP